MPLSAKIDDRALECSGIEFTCFHVCVHGYCLFFFLFRFCQAVFNWGNCVFFVFVVVCVWTMAISHVVMYNSSCSYITRCMMPWNVSCQTGSTDTPVMAESAGLKNAQNDVIVATIARCQMRIKMQLRLEWFHSHLFFLIAACCLGLNADGSPCSQRSKTKLYNASTTKNPMDYCQLLHWLAMEKNKYGTNNELCADNAGKAWLESLFGKRKVKLSRSINQIPRPRTKEKAKHLYQSNYGLAHTEKFADSM